MKPRTLTKTTRQTGKSDMERDKKIRAQAPGKRISSKGKFYYEYRKNRTDVKGRDTPKIVKVKKHTRLDGEVSVKSHDRVLSTKIASSGSNKPMLDLDYKPDPERVARYKERQEAKKQYYENKASKLEKEGESILEADRRKMSAIPFGQPILVGHHSEKRHRRDLERSWNAMDKGFKTLKKAEYYKEKAESTGSGGISSDDPEAVIKLKEKLSNLEEKREKIKEFNQKARKEGKEKAPAYMLQNLSGNIRNVKLRIDDLSKKTQLKTKEYIIKGVKVVEDTDDNRLRLYFDEIPSVEKRNVLKRNGFRWSPSNSAWQRQLSSGAIYSMKRALEEIN